ncbi:MAG: SDR family oxidoreductase [Melioribacteraceae bacterium]|nr:SDR family oxidoreductase [Melioribacteraceae bacterium]
MKTIVITGVTKGIGNALTKRFIKLGYTVIGCGRSEENINGLNSDFPSPHSFTTLNITCAEEVKTWAELILSKYGTPDLLINNATIINRKAPLWEISDKEFSDIVDINIKGTANTIRYFVPEMVKKNKGIIVNLSSGWGRSTSPGVSPYCATKYAVEGLTKALAQELPNNMAAIPFSPGMVNTDMLQSWWGKSADNQIDPDLWAIEACDKILGFSRSDNGMSL